MWDEDEDVLNEEVIATRNAKYYQRRNAPSDLEVILDEIALDTREDKMFESFAKAAMGALVAAGQADFVLLKNDKLRKWWTGVVSAERAAQIKKEAIEHKQKLREQALSKLSDEEKEALGLVKIKR